MNEKFNSNIYKLVDNCILNKDKNVVISGVSIKMALAMLLNGAEGQSKEELESFLGESRKKLNEETINILSEVGDDLKLANSFWFGEPNQINSEYEQIIKKYQNADINLVDFNSKETLDLINNWASDNTNKLINKLLDDLPREITSLLINTLYFKALWSEPFNNFRSGLDKFYGTETTKLVWMMKRTIKNIYFENNYVKGFYLPYYHSPYEFVAVLPNREGEFNLEDLDLNNLKQVNGAYRINVTFPKLDIEYGTKLEDIIKELGVKSPFLNGSDFKSMLSIPQIVDSIIHKTKFKLDEKGTEASAASVVQMARSAMLDLKPPVEINLKFDRPFAFIIRHRETNELLFVGKINNL